MNKSMESWFFMRPGFDTFRLEPEKHCRFLFGKRDRAQRDFVLGEIEGASYSNDGHKAAIYGDYGRGKTHQCHNIVFEIQRRGLKVEPVYIKCSAYESKEPFRSLFREMVGRHSSAELNRVATEYARLVARKEAAPLVEIVSSEDIALVMTKALGAIEQDAVRTGMRWLGGEPKVSMDLISKSLTPQLTDSLEFGAVMRGLAQMHVTVDGKVPLYLIDEAERFENVTHTDTYAKWLASLRELTEILRVGLIFFVGAKTRNALPTIFLQEEIQRRIGTANYIEFNNPSRDELEEFLIEQFQTSIRKGEVPEPHRDVVEPAALDPMVPEELRTITGNDSQRLRTFPFEPEAFAEFLDQVTIGELASKPSEVQIRLQKAAQRAMRSDARTIGSKIVTAIGSEGF